ncbi:MAG TPA: 2-amino-4-hydroxy-6-hydroxymethyldihydropteridine diphosphokinase [Longimicrobiales bacterium]
MSEQSGGEPACFNLPVEQVVTVYLGLGTNLGDRGRNLARALQSLAGIVRVEQASSVYQTEPVGFKDQPEFWNLVVRAATDLPARMLMSELITIETAMGRERTFRNAPRIVDIDILLYDDVVIRAPELEIPHPRMHERAFVLRPLLEIAPDLTHPGTHERFARYLQHAPAERVELIAPPPGSTHETI